MKLKTNDPLLGAAKVILVLARIVFIFGIVMLGIGLGALLTVGRADLLQEIAAADVPAAAYWLIVIAMLTGATMLLLAYRFVGELSGIIDSVGEGDPFHPENASRLGRMGWISLIIQVLILPIGAMTLWFAPYADKVDSRLDFGGWLDWGGIMLTLVLFILARVFRQGAAMRDELEGTV